MICPNCGKSIPDHKVLCPYCSEFLLSDELTETSHDSETDAGQPEDIPIHQRIDPKNFKISFNDEEDEEEVPLADQKVNRSSYSAAAEKPVRNTSYTRKDYGAAPISFPGSESEGYENPASSGNGKAQKVVKKKIIKQKKIQNNGNSKSSRKDQREPKSRNTVEKETVVKTKKSGCGCGCLAAVFLFLAALLVVLYLIFGVIGLDTIKTYVDYFSGKDVSVSVDVSDSESQTESAPESITEEEPVNEEESSDPAEDSSSESEGGKWDAVFENLPDSN